MIREADLDRDGKIDYEGMDDYIGAFCFTYIDQPDPAFLFFLEFMTMMLARS